jgi:hypothetical protein
MSQTSAQAAGRGIEQKNTSTGLAATGESVVRVPLKRSLRRAAERRARKLARKEVGQPQFPHANATEEVLSEAPVTEQEPPTVEAPSPVVPSEARLTANRLNAQRSTGPKTEQGRAKSSGNALRTALTGRTVLLPGDDGERYATRLAEYKKVYLPVGVRETEIVQVLADTWWRLERIPGLIEALYVKGCNEFIDRATDLDPQARLTMLRMETYVAYERQFRNLELQENRLFRYAQKLKAELAELQKERDQREADKQHRASDAPCARSEEFSRAAMLYLAAKKDRQPFHPADFGFEFSIADIESYLHGQRARQVADEAAGRGQITPQVKRSAA